MNNVFTNKKENGKTTECNNAYVQMENIQDNLLFNLETSAQLHSNQLRLKTLEFELNANHEAIAEIEKLMEPFKEKINAIVEEKTKIHQHVANTLQKLAGTAHKDRGLGTNLSALKTDTKSIEERKKQNDTIAKELDKIEKRWIK